jgi:hypothetical protein
VEVLRAAWVMTEKVNVHLMKETEIVIVLVDGEIVNITDRVAGWKMLLKIHGKKIQVFHMKIFEKLSIIC